LKTDLVSNNPTSRFLEGVDVGPCWEERAWSGSKFIGSQNITKENTIMNISCVSLQMKMTEAGKWFQNFTKKV
jgi:hypothetical protein